MDRTIRYQIAIINFLETYAEAQYGEDPSNIETEVIKDLNGQHFQLIRLGWNDDKYVYFTAFHIDIKNEKIWVRINNTEEMIADELIKRGIEKSEIVLAFHPPSLRKYTEFAMT